MQTLPVTIAREHARILYREYKKHRHYETPVDQEIRRAYQLLAQGRMIIRAIESVVAAGVNEQGLPKLALCRADSATCEVHISRDGSATMKAQGARLYYRNNNYTTRALHFSAGSFPGARWIDGTALLPLIPLHLRPRRALANYHVLWEAEWNKVVPRDPYLLRRIGKADLWIVLAMWDLTDVERAALRTRVPA